MFKRKQSPKKLQEIIPIYTKISDIYDKKDYADMARFLWCYYSATSIDETGCFFPYFKTDRDWLSKLLRKSWFSPAHDRSCGRSYWFLNSFWDWPMSSNKDPLNWSEDSEEEINPLDSDEICGFLYRWRNAERDNLDAVKQNHFTYVRFLSLRIN